MGGDGLEPIAAACPVSARLSPLFLLERIVSASPEPLEAVPPVIYLVVKRTVTNRSGYYMTA